MLNGLTPLQLQTLLVFTNLLEVSEGRELGALNGSRARAGWSEDAVYDRGAPLFFQHYPSIWELKT